MEGEKMSSWKKNVVKNVCKALGISMDEPESEEQKIKKAMIESLASILQDEKKTLEQKEEILQKSIHEFFDAIYDFAKSENEILESNFITEEDKIAYKALKKKYEPEIQAEPKQPILHSEVKKALQEAETAKQELEELKKALELKEFENIAKQYEVIGKNTEELATKLYGLKKSDEQSYNDYIAMLDEMVEMTQASGIFKEYGSSRTGAGSQKQQAEQRIQELMKSDSSLTYAQAFTRV